MAIITSRIGEVINGLWGVATEIDQYRYTEVNTARKQESREQADGWATESQFATYLTVTRPAQAFVLDAVLLALTNDLDSRDTVFFFKKFKELCPYLKYTKSIRILITAL